MNRTISITGLYNIRDLGGLPNKYSKETVFGRYLRSDSLHTIDDNGKSQLLVFGVRTIIDLRYADECARAPNPLASHTEIKYYNIPLMVGGVIENNAEDLTQLGAFYRFLLQNSQSALSRVFTTMAEHNGATLFHCQIGKDRTGVVAAILLLLAGTPVHHIVADYVATAEHIAPLLPILRQHRPEQITSEQYERLLDARAEYIEEFIQELLTRYGSVEQYLLRIGVEESHIDLLRNSLVYKRFNTQL